MSSPGDHNIVKEGSSSSNVAATFEFGFGRTDVIKPKGKHQATIVWLHGLGDKAPSWTQMLESLPLPNIKWICPTAPTRPVKLFGGFSSTAWFDVGDLSEEDEDDLEGLDVSAAHVANLLSAEPPDVKLGVGGFDMGAATALFSATCQALGRYANGNPYQINLSAIFSLSGWLPCSRKLKDWIEESEGAELRASALPILICHGQDDDVVEFERGKQSAETLGSIGFKNLAFQSYEGLGHYTIPLETEEICHWLATTMELDGCNSD